VNSLAPLIEEAQRVLAEAVRHFGLKVDPASFVVTIHPAGARQALGWFWAGRWANGVADKLNEINLSAEHLKGDVGEVLLHELAHAENHANGLKDCAGKVHNARFKAMAERLGLEVLPRDRRVGYGFTKRGPEADAFLASAGFKSEVFALVRGAEVSGKKGSRQRLWTCACGVKVRVASDDFQATCGRCGGEFFRG